MDARQKKMEAALRRLADNLEDDEADEAAAEMSIIAEALKEEPRSAEEAKVKDALRRLSDKLDDDKALEAAADLEIIVAALAEKTREAEEAKAEIKRRADQDAAAAVEEMNDEYFRTLRESIDSINSRIMLLKRYHDIYGPLPQEEAVGPSAKKLKQAE